mgnify:CR=1 FL=1
MTGMLITPTLLNAFQWYTGYYAETPEDEQINREDFLRMLRREPMEAPGESIMLGRELEEDIVDYCKAGGYDGARKDIKEIGDKWVGGMFQVSVKRELDGDLLYGRVDVMRGEFMRDGKFCKQYDVGKFLHSAQHRIYLYCVPTVPRFVYDISDRWNVYEEEYANHAKIESELRGMIADFKNFLRNTDAEANELFNKHWKALS